MTIRTSQKTVTFSQPFVLAGFDEVLPAGAYCVETDEELIQGVSFSAYQRISTLLRLPSTRGPSQLSRAVAIDAGELEAALKRDAESTSRT